MRIRQVVWAAVLTFFAASSVQAFQLVTLDEERTNLLDYVGDGQRWTLVMFWATDCIPCEEQKPAFEAFHQQFKDSNASVLGVAVDGVENKAAIHELVEHHQPTYPNLMAFSDVYHRQFEELTDKPFIGTPRYALFTPDGKLEAESFGKMDFKFLAQYIASKSQ